MKNKIKSLKFFAIIFLSLASYSQVSVSVQDLQYTNNGQPTISVTNCGNIDLATSTSTSINLGINLSKPNGQSVGLSNLYVYTLKSSSDYRFERSFSQIQETFWNHPSNGNDTFSTTASFTINSSEFNVSGGTLFVVFKSSSGVEYQTTCSFTITKTPLPTFTLTPPTVSIPCGDTSARTFTVTPANIPTGANVTYQWSYNNWTELSGSTTTSRTLQPSSGSVLPSSVSVTPYINGVAQTTKTSTVSRASFTAGSLTISGSNYVCDTGQYTINDLPSYISIQSVGSSNTNVATVSLTGSNQITVTKVSDGLATITVLLQNACSQTTTISKQIQVGIPASASNGTISGANYICNNQTYTYTVNGASHPCITSYAWEVSPNLSIISQDVNSITVAQNTFNTAYAGNIKYKIPGSTIELSKSIWVGLPNNNELSIDKIGSYDFYVGTWTKLKASYQTLIYANSGEYNFTYEWQIPNSLIRNYTDTAYKDVNPNYSGQLNIGVRAWNECGCSDWKYQLFSVGGGSGNNELTPMKP